ncbi:MAG: hypothetical protein KBC72_14885 [Acinetobacter sp.]|jgi:hypothetical protein|nr:hypothetical protein [Acinetobacter sp.]
MDELNKSLLNYRKAFKAKLDAYSSSSMAIPIIKNPLPPIKQPPISKPKKPIFDNDDSIILETEPYSSPQKTPSIKKPSEATTHKSKPKEKISATRIHDPSLPIFTPPIIDNSRPLPNPTPKRNITYRIITSFSFRFSLGILLLLLL